MDSESNQCFTWLSVLREAAHNRWTRFHEGVRAAFGWNSWYAKKPESHRLEKQTGDTKIVRRDRRKTRSKDGYVPYLPSPLLSLPADISVWSAFYPYTTDIECISPIKPTVHEHPEEFSIWCAIFQVSTDAGLATLEKSVKSFTKTPFSTGRFTMAPTTLHLPTSLSTMSLPVMVNLSQSCRRQEVRIVMPSLVAPTILLLCSAVSTNEISITAVMIPCTKASGSFGDVPRASVSIHMMSPSTAEIKAMVSSVRSVFPLRFMETVAKPMFLVVKAERPKHEVASGPVSSMMLSGLKVKSREQYEMISYARPVVRRATTEQQVQISGAMLSRAVMPVCGYRSSTPLSITYGTTPAASVTECLDKAIAVYSPSFVAKNVPSSLSTSIVTRRYEGQGHACQVSDPLFSWASQYEGLRLRLSAPHVRPTPSVGPISFAYYTALPVCSSHNCLRPEYYRGAPWYEVPVFSSPASSVSGTPHEACSPSFCRKDTRSRQKDDKPISPSYSSQKRDDFSQASTKVKESDANRLSHTPSDSGNRTVTSNGKGSVASTDLSEDTDDDFDELSREIWMACRPEEANVATHESKFTRGFQPNMDPLTSSSHSTDRESKANLYAPPDDARLSRSKLATAGDIQDQCPTVSAHENTTASASFSEAIMAEDDDLLARFIGKSLAAEIRGSVPESRPVLDPCNSQRFDAARAKRNPDTYDKETFQIFRQNESKFRADPCYMERQVNITHEMRNETISWMVEIADYVGISRTSLFLSVNFFDRFLSMCSTTKNNLQLVAVTCMFIAGKIEKGENAASVGDYIYLTAGAYIGDQILRLEKLILKKLQFSLYAPTIDWFCTELLNVCKADEKLKYMTMYLAEVTMLDASYIGASPSLIAAASLVLARHYVGLPVWTMELWEISSYLPNDNLLCINYIAETCAFYRTIDDPSLQGILRKYSAQKYLEIANIQTFPEQDFDSLQRKCREFGREFISPSRSHSRRVRYNKFNRRDTPMTYDPSAKQLPFFKARMKREFFEGYAAETYRIMVGLENKYRADQAYVNRQTNIDISLRKEEVNWMMWFIEDKEFATSSFLLAVNLLDRVLSLRSVPREKMRLVSVTCLFIMRKFESMDINIIDTFLKAVEYIYRKQEIIYMQMTILKLLDFHLMAPTAAWFADELLDVCEADDTLRALTGYLLELTTLQMRYLQYRPSQIGATALFVARYSLGLRPWTKKLLERSGYKLKDSLGCLRSLYDDYKMSQFQAEFLQYKYRKLEYMEVSDFTKYPVPDIFYLLDFYFREMDKARNH